MQQNLATKTQLLLWAGKEGGNAGNVPTRVESRRLQKLHGPSGLWER